ncbi:hypothetical protein FSP39_015198 [Pinctada imbricata]|uniref:RNA-directed DNA polymerase n=1 Tax=Pinctada imbricata TaxID=66713 RepID=A0AA88YJG0_PINIB|nr:hypothetical protein FSP39_015198 [Pinctada imbricata]
MTDKEEIMETFNSRSLRVMERMDHEVQILTESIRELTIKQDQMISQQRDSVNAIEHFAVSVTNILEKTLCSGDSPKHTQSEDPRQQSSQVWSIQSNETRGSKSPLRGRHGDSPWSPYEYNQDMDGFGGGTAANFGFDSRGDSPWQTCHGTRPYTSTPRRDSYCPPFHPFDSNYQRSFERSFENRSRKHDIPHQKLPTFDGTGDWDGFMLPFKRASKRYQWFDEEKLDRFVECFRGHASKFITTLPLSVQENFDRLAKMMEDRFNRKDPPTTARKRLEDLRQKGETDDEFAEEARRLVARAFPSVAIALQEELAAEAFLKGYRNSRVGYEALNKAPKTVSEALDIVVQLQHNYKATVGRDTEMRRSSRRVSWEDQYLDVGESKGGVFAIKSPASDQKTIQEEIKELKELFLSNLEAKRRPRSPSPSKGCFKCGDKNHFQRDCPTNKSSANTGCYNCGDPAHFKKDCPQKERSDKINQEQNHSTDEGNDTTIKPPVLQIGKKTGGRSISVLIEINDIEAEAIVDTGADVSVLSREFARHLQLKFDNKDTIHLMNAEDGKEMEAICDVKVKLRIGNSTIDWPFYICPTRDNVLIGMDLLEALDAVVLARQGDLVINGKVVVGKGKGSNDFHIARVQVAKDTTLKPFSETIITGKVDDQAEGITAVLDPASLKIGSVLVQVQEEITIRILNATPKQLKLSSGTHLGKLVEIDKNDDKGMKTKEEPSLEVPDHLKTLIESFSKQLEGSVLTEATSLIVQFQDIFVRNSQDLGCFSPVKHKIQTGDALPIKQPVRRTPIGFKDEEKDHLESLIKSGIVVPSQSEWASPVVLVRKKDGGVRWCIDYRKVNSVTTKDSYPLPNIEECIDTLAGATVFSTIDLQQGYHQIEVDPDDRLKTAFITRYGLFEYTRMPFGLCGAPGTFQRAMEFVLRGLQWDKVLIYLDDVIIASKGVEEHLVHLTEVFNRFRDSDLKLKPSKCSFFQEKVLFLGHIISKEGVETNPDLTKVVKEWPIPTKVKDVQSFLGLTNYYRRFVDGYAQIAEPLYRLVNKNTAFIWGRDQQAAFEELKLKLTSPPILAFPLPEALFILDTDASNFSIGAVLSQLQNGEERVISYASKRLEPRQERYCVTRRELLAVVNFTEKFKHYLLGRRFIIRTDHGSLTWLFRFKAPQDQLARWLEQLSQFDFVLQHRKGQCHGNADALSRYPLDEGCDCYNAGKEPHDLPCGGCDHCRKVHNKWQRFNSDVDDVIPLSMKRKAEDNVCGHSASNTETADVIRQLSESKGQEFSGHSAPYMDVSLDGRYDTEVLEEKQLEEADLGTLHKWLKEGFPESKKSLFSSSPALRHYWLCREQLLLKDGLLCYKWIGPEGTRNLLIVPETLQRELLKVAHDSPLAGHPGIKRTLQRLRLNFYWFNMTDTVSTYIASCAACATSKKQTHTVRAEMQEYYAGAPLDRIQLDILGPFPKSAKGNKYILVLVDQFSKWTECYPLPDQSAESIAEVLVKEFIARFGVPLELHTDQGRNFDSDLMRRLSKLYGWAKTRTTPYHPSSNGLVERYNRTLLQMMRCFVSQSQEDWDAGAYRSTPHTSTGLTPNRLMLGREVHLPEEVMFGLHQISNAEDMAGYIERLRSSLGKCWEIARENLKMSSKNQKKLHDLRKFEHKLEVGDLVYIKDDTKKVGKSPKLQPLWKGPAIVAKRLGPVLYEVQDKKKTHVLHHNRLKPCFMETIPLWINRFRHSLKDDEDRVWTQCPTIAENDEDIPATDKDIRKNPDVIVAHTSSGMDTDPTRDMRQQSDSGKQFPGLSGASITAMAAETTHAEITDPAVGPVDATDSDTNRKTEMAAQSAHAGITDPNIGSVNVTDSDTNRKPHQKKK